ncbi:MAG: hypothetical protein IPJ90_01225 [Anaerolineaceae bacterium]|nr:hypothetical protein [Anaerolineaceae bacterium]
MNDVSESVLQESLDLLEQGLPIEQILARYPDHVAALRPFLQTALQLATVAPQPSLAAKQRSQKAFLAHAESLKVTPVQPSAWYRLRQILLPLVSLAAVVILFGATAVSVSGSAIPGDTLYTVKRLVEDVRLNGADDPETAVALVESYRQERIREVQTLLRTGRAAEASFEGEVQALQTDQWTVAEIDIQLNAATRITGQPRLGELARVNGRTENGVFTAETIEILTGSVAEPEQEPTPEPSPPAAPSATATATLTPTPAPTEALTATATATLTATPHRHQRPRVRQPLHPQRCRCQPPRWCPPSRRPATTTTITTAVTITTTMTMMAKTTTMTTMMTMTTAATAMIAAAMTTITTTTINLQKPLRFLVTLEHAS